jgi:hypothetical protein
VIYYEPTLLYVSTYSLISQTKGLNHLNKILNLFVVITLVFLGFLSGQYLSDRFALKQRIIDTKEHIAVTKVLLEEHLSGCNKVGYKRFATFHEHNIERVYRMTQYAIGYPYFLGEKFAVEIGVIFDSYKLGFEKYKSEFKHSCGSVYSDSTPNV